MRHAVKTGLLAFLVIVGSVVGILPSGDSRVGRQAAPAAATSAAPAPTGTVQVEMFQKMPLYFIENRGQLDSRVAYYVQGQDKTLYFTKEGLTLALTDRKREQATPKGKLEKASLPRSQTGQESSPASRWIVKLDFVGANPDVTITAEEKTAAIVSYFKGRPEEWKTGLATFNRVVYSDLWPGIDLVYSGTVDRLKYRFVVKPGADPDRIQLAYRGATKVGLAEGGRLEIETPAGGFQDDEPHSYQDIEGRRISVETSYALAPSAKDQTQTYGFNVGTYDRTRPLVLDPAVLVYAGYIGGSGDDVGYGIAVDSSGNAYVSGYTTSSETTFPVTVGPDLTFGGGTFNGTDAFVAKVNATGTALVYAGYIGGSDDDFGFSIAVDSSGSAYVTGTTRSTETTFPVTVGPDLTQNGLQDAFVAKVSAAGTALVYAGYIGGNCEELGFGIAVDSLGNAYVSGQTCSTAATFPVTVGPDLTENGGQDVFVAKVNTAGTALAYAGYIGGNGHDYRGSVAVDTSGNAYVTGVTGSTEATFPVTVGPDLTHNGSDDAFVAKVNAAGTALVYAGYIGGSGLDLGHGVAVVADNAYVTGDTDSTEATFPVVAGPDLTYNGFGDAFVAKVNATGTTLDYCGYIGGSGSDIGNVGNRIAVNSSGNAYVTGYTASTEATFPVAVGPDLTYNGSYDAFVAKINAAGTAFVYVGYIGGSGDDLGNGIAVDNSGNAYITGATGSTEATFPVTVGPDLTYNGGAWDVFVAKIAEVAGATPTPTPTVVPPTNTPTPTPSHTTGLAVIKTCPVSAAPGSTFNCQFSVQNQDVLHGVINLGVTNTVPFPGGITTGVACLQSGDPVTSLGPNGTATDTCDGEVVETAPACGATNVFLADQINAAGQDEGIQTLTVQGSAIASALIPACTPTPTPTVVPPTITPTPTATVVPPTITPTVTPTPFGGCGTITVSPTTLANGTVGGTVRRTFSASGGTAPYTFRRTAGSLPPGLSLSTAGVLSGSPTTPGTYSFTVTATDANDCSGSRAYTMRIVCSTVTVSPTVLAAAAQGTAYSQTLTASGGRAPHTFAVTGGALPAGLVLSSGGVLSGTPTVSGSFTFTVTATDASGCSGSATYTLSVCVAALTVSPGTLPAATVGAVYGQTLVASGGAPPYAFAVTSGALPAGLTLSPAGALSGVPTAAGLFSFAVTATDVNGCPGVQTYALRVCPVVALSPTTLPGGAVGTAYSQALTGSGGTGPYTFAASGSLPPGLALSSTGVLSGTPTQSGSFAFTATATDVNGCPGLQGYTVVVTDVPPMIEELNLAPGDVGSFGLSVTGSGFVSGAVVVVNGVAYPTTFVSPTLVTVVLPASAVPTTGSITVTVTNPGATGGTSNPATLTFCSPPGVPLNPTIEPAGNPTGPITATDFLRVRWDAPATGPAPAFYQYRINGDSWSAPVFGTSALALPRGTNDPITLFVRAHCNADVSSPAAASPTYSLAPPVANFTFSSARVGSPVVFTDTSSPQATSWLWIFDDGGISTAQSPTHTFTTAGTHRVALIASNGSGSSQRIKDVPVSASTSSGGAVTSSVRSFERSEAGRWGLAEVAISGAGSVWLELTSEETEEAIVYLRFIDSEGWVVLERRLSVAPGQSAVNDVSAYGLEGIYTLELVSSHKITPLLLAQERDVPKIERRSPDENP